MNSPCSSRQNTLNTEKCLGLRIGHFLVWFAWAGGLQNRVCTSMAPPYAVKNRRCVCGVCARMFSSEKWEFKKSAQISRRSSAPLWLHRSTANMCFGDLLAMKRRNSKEEYWGRSTRGHGKWRNSCAIVQWCATIAQILRNSCASKPWKTSGSAWKTSSVWETIALPFVSYCVSFCELLRLFPWPLLLRPQYPSNKEWLNADNFLKPWAVGLLSGTHLCIFVHTQHDCTTGVPDNGHNGNEWRKFRRTSLAPLAPCFVLCWKGVETEGLVDYKGRGGIMSIVRWNLRLVIFGVHLGLWSWEPVTGPRTRKNFKVAWSD